MKQVNKNILKTFISMLVALLPMTSADAQPLKGWSLVWSDEFNDTTLDAKKWQLELNEGDHGITTYTDRVENLQVSGGCLALQARKENLGDQPYTSTQVSTRNKGYWKYGRFDIRAKLPYGKGMWPAIWMMPNRPVAYGVWPKSGEIDIMENLGDNPRLLYSTLHFGTTNQMIQGTFTTPAGQSLSDSFHVFTMIWDTGSFAFYVDSVNNYWNTNTWSPNNVTYPKPFDQPFFMMFDLAVGGSWGGPPDNATIFPQKMLIDWIRVYKRENSSEIQQNSKKELTGKAPVSICGKWIELKLNAGASVKLSLHDMTGREVVRVNDTRKAGLTHIPVPATLSRGFYVWKLVTDGRACSGRFVVD
ncbi:MAG TPA: family 16 glycosylhydrolase [Chitinispirillaceae bacterium]|nr:family 16 glycosylhydrolase [Chitinispirillaceae bacterium]